jgi:hypothetical protein
MPSATVCEQLIPEYAVPDGYARYGEQMLARQRFDMHHSALDFVDINLVEFFIQRRQNDGQGAVRAVLQRKFIPIGHDQAAGKKIVMINGFQKARAQF